MSEVQGQTGNLVTTRGTIVNIILEEKVGTKGPYKRLVYTLDTGKTFNLFASKKTGLPTLDKKDIQGLEVGANVVVAESRNGQYYNVIGVDVLPQSSKTAQDILPSSQGVTASIAPQNNTATSKTDVTQLTQGLQTQTEKQESIIIQAFMKSLIEGSNGAYLRLNNQDGKEYLNMNREALRSHVKECLLIHDDILKLRTGN